MKNLYNRDQLKNFAGFAENFVWQNNNAPATKVNESAADKVEKSFDKLQEVLQTKKNVANNLNLLKKDTDITKVLNETYESLSDYRKEFLDKGSDKVQKKLKESDIEKKFAEMTQSEEVKNYLKKSVGLVNIIDNPTDADDVLDLDEMTNSRDFVAKNTDLIISALENDIDANNPAEKEKLKKAFESIIDKINEIEQKFLNGEITQNEKFQKQKEIQEALMLELKKNGWDMGKMLEKFAALAKQDTRNNKSDIDAVLEQYVRENSPKPPSETDEAPSGSMEELYQQNPELAKFLAEYYPTPSGKDLGDDLKTFGIKSIEELPDFFLNAKLGNATKSVKEELRNFNNEEAFNKLKAKIIADEKNDAPATSIMGSVKDSLRDLYTDMKSFMPASFEHFHWTSEDVMNANSVEELFLNKIREKLGLSSQKSGGKYEQRPKRKLTLDGIISLTKPLSLEKNASMIQWLEKDIPMGYRGTEWAEKYRGALINGKTRKNFENWLGKDSGISAPERLWNKFGNIWFYILQIASWLGIGSAKEKLEELKKRRESDKDKPNKKKINEAMKTQKEEREKQDNYNKWEHASPQETDDLANFYTKYSKLINLPEEAEIKKMVSPEEFTKNWINKNKKERNIVSVLDDFALKVPHDKISFENWKKLVKNFNDDNNTYKIDGATLSYTPGELGRRVIEKWNNEAIEKLLKPDPREKVWEEYAGNEEKEGIFADDLNASFFMKHVNDLFADPQNPDATKLKPFWQSLFNLPAEFYKDGKLSSSDLEALINAVKAGKLDNGFDEEIDPEVSWTSSILGGGNDYWTIDNDKLAEVHDDVMKKSGKKIEERPDLFAVDLNGNNSMFNENFASVKALVERLKQNI